MQGKLVYMVGPSGSGKDSVLGALAADLPPDWIIMKRTVTREESPANVYAESLSHEVFRQQQRQGAFALSWEAHGLLYGIRSELDAHLQAGKLVLVNGSREHWEQVKQQYAQAALVWLTVAPELLLQRLQQRGRESVDAISLRVQRNQQIEQQFRHKLGADASRSVYMLDNSYTLAQTVANLRVQLQQWHKQSLMMRTA
ncbi:phosphonate metabolism protein/1,5-bisphosphokinase (PRPP-forming) PhnN [Paenalcaligenes suwonensis]|uniref:phosphonate metabolism protein/1,5-bisphosphokinase (PRPP-forming) PhnN n=1 Tax=Paenalcaligenes suwonensis TaxID=1202713 RepID=UPI00140A12D2|nr:phosphonate metabolism protein/1,5-bisphosphokinase (PRPP-forming) PhnN [Paenalcaligenes suwonensis]NHC61055.1 phosphonate metabolism protein/1,5-bisphosphokinase (PRPP-forming) PhnN [Paenalcaligenes suwonensis]